MTAAAIIAEATANGVELALAPDGTIKLGGTVTAVRKWVDHVVDNRELIQRELEQVRELDALISTLSRFYRWTQADEDEAREVARGDLSTSLVSIRALVAEMYANRWPKSPPGTPRYSTPCVCDCSACKPKPSVLKKRQRAPGEAFGLNRRNRFRQ